MRGRSLLAALVLLILTVGFTPEAPALSKLILSLGRDGYLSKEAIEATTGAEVRREPGEFELTDFSMIILSNTSFGSLPLEFQQGLTEFVQKGGALLITGGPQSFGSGGYEAIAPLLPMGIRAPNDWVFKPFRAVIPLKPDHPILAGITLPMIGSFNDLNPKTGATEIAQYAGGGGGALGIGEERIGGAGFPAPLIAEQRIGAGLVVAVAFDPNELGFWRDRDAFVVNAVKYLLENSRLGPPRPKRQE